MDGSPTVNKRREARRFKPPEGKEAKPIRAVEESTRREHESAKISLRIFAQSQVEYINQASSLRGAWKQATRRRLLHGAKADGVGG